MRTDLIQAVFGHEIKFGTIKCALMTEVRKGHKGQKMAWQIFIY